MILLSIGGERACSFLDDDTDTNGVVLRVTILGAQVEIYLTASWIK